MDSIKKIVNIAKKVELGVTVMGAVGLLYLATINGGKE